MIKDNLPGYYKKSEFITCLNAALENEKTIFKAYLDSIKQEFFIKTAQEYIYNWEREFNVPSYLSQSLTTRRGNVLARLRGFGTLTKSLLKKIVEGFYEGEVIRIVEDFDNSIVYMYFTTLTELPENYLEFERSLNELFPAHLGYEYSFVFILSTFTHAELEEYEHRILEGAIHG